MSRAGSTHFNLYSAGTTKQQPRSRNIPISIPISPTSPKKKGEKKERSAYPL